VQVTADLIDTIKPGAASASTGALDTGAKVLRGSYGGGQKYEKGSNRISASRLQEAAT
jgi:hypothetical protein